MKQLATVDSRKGTLVVSSYSRTIPGFWIMNGTFVTMHADGDEQSLGQAVFDALDASTDGLAPPSRNGPSPFAGVLRDLGLSSYGQYMEGAVSVGVCREGEGLVVTPKRNGGVSSGFVEMCEKALLLDGSEPVALARAVRKALADGT
jgi:hypothetical protein